MPYSGLLPSREAIRDAWHAPLEIVPRSHREFAEVILWRARQIELQWVKARDCQLPPERIAVRRLQL